MSEDSNAVRKELGLRIAEFKSRATRMSPLAIHAQMDAIRQAAELHGLLALESLAHCSAQMALLPGHRVATTCCFDHMDEALESRRPEDGATILAHLAARLH